MEASEIISFLRYEERILRRKATLVKALGTTFTYEPNWELQADSLKAAADYIEKAEKEKWGKIL